MTHPEVIAFDGAGEAALQVADFESVVLNAASSHLALVLLFITGGRQLL